MTSSFGTTVIQPKTDNPSVVLLLIFYFMTETNYFRKMSDQKAVYSIEIQAAGEFPSNDNLMLSLSGNKNGSPCDSPLTRLIEPSQENQNSRKYELETVKECK